MRVVLADDSGIFREGLRLLLMAAHVDVVAVAATVTGLSDVVTEHRPEVAVIDVRLPPTFTDEGIRAAVALRDRWPTLGLLVLSTDIDPSWLTVLLDAVPTGIGYLLKDRVDDVRSLLEAMDRVAAGGIALDPEVVRVMVSARRVAGPLERLTPREREVLALVAEGRSNVGIARALHVTAKTVEAHVAAIFRALDLETADTENRRVQAALAFLATERPRTV
jgi:DNA-binding NarL/FixJ family response regulator